MAVLATRGLGSFGILSSMFCIQIESLSRYADVLDAGGAWIGQLTHIAASTSREVKAKQVR